MEKIKRISIIGNGGGGKTTLSRKLSQKFSLPLTSVDSIQYLPGFAIRSSHDTAKILKELQSQENWIIDGFGPIEIIFERFQKSDLIIFVDFPYWRHQWWAFKRQLKGFFGYRRIELVEGCDERGLRRTYMMYQTIKRVNNTIIPKLRAYLRQLPHSKVVTVKNIADWNNVLSYKLK